MMLIIRKVRWLLYTGVIMLLVANPKACEKPAYEKPACHLPQDFVYVKDINPSIIESLRYYSKENFIGIQIDGYKANRVILTKQAAEALSNVQQELLKQGYSLVVYDAYRPQRAVDMFITWSQDLNDQVEKSKYYPRVDKSEVFQLGYVTKKSGHTRGSTVDLTIIKLNSVPHEVQIEKRYLTDGSQILFLNDGTIDMGSSFDLFDEASHHDTALVKPEFLKMRDYLREIMKKNGFYEYKKEWWHYTLKDEPFPNTYFDFDVE